MRVGDKYICIKEGLLFTFNKEYKLMEISEDRYWFKCDGEYSRFIRDDSLDYYFISVKKYRKQKLLKLKYEI